jgi:hypothetical protein
MWTNRHRAAVFAGAHALGLFVGLPPAQAVQERIDDKRVAAVEPAPARQLRASVARRAAYYAFDQGDFEAAAVMWSQCAEAGEAPCQSALAYMLMLGRGVEKDNAAAIALLTRAVEADDAYAALLLAVMHYYGTGEEGWEPDHARAFELFSKADRAGDPVARAELGMMHLRGDGVPADRAKAIRLLLSAGRDGVPLALVRAGGLLREASPEKDLGAAASAFLMAAEMNFPSGMYFFAEMLRQGQGIKADRVEAMKWYLLAAEHPDADEAIKSLAARSVTLHKAQLSFWDFRRARTLAKTWLEQPDPDR